MFAAPLSAQTIPFDCEGSDPDWKIEIRGDTATFAYGRSFQFTIPQRNDAENREWPKAMTLVEDQQRYTAIIVVDKKACTTDFGDYPLSAYVLTQRASIPILLAGCCTLPETDSE
jgi:hypothetical protein